MAALGSGAFLNEAIDQTAALYLKLREEETGDRLEPEERAPALQQQSDAFEGWTLRKPVRLGVRPAACRRGVCASVHHHLRASVVAQKRTPLHAETGVQPEPHSVCIAN